MWSTISTLNESPDEVQIDIDGCGEEKNLPLLYIKP